MPSIIHELTLLQEREGWLSPESLADLARRLNVPLHRVESVSTFYTHFRRTPPKRTTVHVCRDLACWMAGGPAAREDLARRLGSRDDVEIVEVSCLGRCEAAPVADVAHRTVPIGDPERAVAWIDAPEEAPYGTDAKVWAADPYAAGSGETDPDSDSTERPLGGERFGVLRRILEAGDREAPVRVLEEAGLRGMGGAGFPTGRKWRLVAGERSTPKHVICNADESEPGTFKDRVVLHDLPHLVLEGMAIAGFAVGASRGTVFIRHEYGPERERVEAAIRDARSAGALGRNVHGLGFDFDVDVFVSPGGYILGEETALLECMEDRRGEPRNKPPFPGQKGLFGRPTLINNVETFAHAVGILGRGVEWWRSLGAEGFAGHKFLSVSGDVASPGVLLVPMGTTLRDLLEACGGMAAGKELAAIAPGGASSNFLGPDALDTPLDFETLARAGSMLGSGAVVFVSTDHDLIEVGLSVTRFFRNESCGKCVPCRVGSQKAVAMLEGRAGVSSRTADELELLDETLRQTSICGLGQVALGPLLSVLRNFPRAEAATESS